ncbi:DNA repair protein XRCC3 [Diachasma alloeum]|uniref:X-ray repair cross complementing protein 3 n=1 Tax=Diachasma alloeum TaxID=454923 RepID=A0A4E0S3T7_9HYME|nr:DNA repair protein XRCC3 [Diachasma alloeum]THK33085.1 x-ray repair cross complementing protein 3 [Diachasma alloeum]
MNSATTATEFLTKEDYLTTGCSKIDGILRGGISKRGITQIYGEAGTGKTQFALQLCLTAQISPERDSRKGVLYICTESVFPSKRLQELLKTSPISKKYKSTSDLIFVEHISTVGDLENCILTRVPVFLANNSIALLIIDSIAASYRVEYEENQLKSRAKSLRSIGHALHGFSMNNNLCVVCINQVSANMGAGKSLCHDNKPVLGVTWACQVTNSINFCRVNDQRHIHVRESSYVPRASLAFDITQAGVFGSSIL